jgi:hypothetical protein
MSSLLMVWIGEIPVVVIFCVGTQIFNKNIMPVRTAERGILGGEQTPAPFVSERCD